MRKKKIKNPCITLENSSQIFLLLFFLLMFQVSASLVLLFCLFVHNIGLAVEKRFYFLIGIIFFSKGMFF